MKSVQGHFGWKITFQDFLNCTCLFFTSFCRVNSNYLKPIWNLMQKTRFNQNASLMEKGNFSEFSWKKRKRKAGSGIFFNATLSIRLNVDNLISKTLFSFFLCAQLNLLSNLSCEMCNQLEDWIDPSPIFRNWEILPRQGARPDRLIVPVINRQTCRVSTRFHFNFNLFQFQQGRQGKCVSS